MTSSTVRRSVDTRNSRSVFAAVREDVQTLCVAIAVIAVLAGSAFAGPIGVWLYAGVGGCVAVLALAAFQFRQRRQ